MRSFIAKSVMVLFGLAMIGIVVVGPWPWAGR